MRDSDKREEGGWYLLTIGSPNSEGGYLIAVGDNIEDSVCRIKMRTIRLVIIACGTAIFIIFTSFFLELTKQHLERHVGVPGLVPTNLNQTLKKKTELSSLLGTHRAEAAPSV